MEKKDIILQLEHISFEYEKEKKVLEEISFSLERGESIGLVGANGMGKSTLLKLLTGLLELQQGDITLLGLPMKKSNLSAIREKIGYVFQDSDNQLFMPTVYEDIVFGPLNYGYGSQEVKERAKKAISMMHLEHIKDKPIYRLSGGEKKLASIATILSMSPEIILMDEPTIALDPQNRRNLIRILNSLPQSKIIASHDLDMILDTTSRTILLWNGEIVGDGDTKDILTDKVLLEEHGLELPLGLIGRKIN